ncbi:MAG: twin-arginine translocase subunit TatC [Myxococcales bacterium]|nr:twin-arginine translocase subunit TatC [Myxococcales bacterium]MCB9566022.1 twin-arginine translocase subunit TatC [Myxococcales bacterium]MCB9702796.1 twin-arginine translocase subunit TatC [Myxococcales bacterium]
MTSGASKPEKNGQEGLAEGPEGDVPMSFWDHLSDLRSALMKSALGVSAGFAICFTYATEIREFLARPLHAAWVEAGLKGEPQLQVLAMMDAFITDIRVAVAGGIFAATPVIFYQLWAFISPGLYKREKRFVIPFVGASVLLFMLGAGFCYGFVLPWTIQWLFGYTQSTAADTPVIYNLTLNDYIRDTTKILVAFGLVFELPLLAAFLAAAGVIDHRSLLRFWKIAVVLIFIVAAFLTPPEPVSQMMMAIPMIILFFISVGVAYLLSRGHRRAAAEALARIDADERGEADGR